MYLVVIKIFRSDLTNDFVRVAGYIVRFNRCVHLAYIAVWFIPNNFVNEIIEKQSWPIRVDMDRFQCGLA